MVASFRLMEQVIAKSEADPDVPRKVVRLSAHRRKNPAAVALGRKGGRNSAAGRMEKIDPDERRRIASVAARARWAKEKGNG